MTLKYKIQVVSESTDYMTDEPENNWFILFEIDEFDDETIIGMCIAWRTTKQTKHDPRMFCFRL